MSQANIIKDLSGYTPTWCPGCGNWGIIRALKLALSEQGLGPTDIFVAFDIGCSGNMNDFLHANSMHTLHGRSIPSAIGMKLAHHTKQVLAVGGDGALYGEGGNHLLHACRGNHDITVVAHDNMVYGLTTGQTAPTSTRGMKTKSTPGGSVEMSINPLALAISQGATFVAQTFANNSRHVADMIKAAMQHKGFSLVNILQPCVTFNWVNTYQYFFEHTYYLGSEYDKSSMPLALLKSLEHISERFPLGVLYEKSDSVPYHLSLPMLRTEKSLVSRADRPDLSFASREFV
ncbi:MAG: thiamine pyrophosphate-dependent enzyme [Candidatus Roizmanbacteria bacterium]